MKATHGSVLGKMVLAMLLLLAFAIGLLGCTAQSQQATPTADTGPNAGLSNEQLVSLAITNMKALKSYHFEFKGGMPSMDVRMSSNLSITADVQLHGKGARWRVRDEGGGVSGGVGGMNYDVGAGIDGVRATGGHWYESYDGGKTWALPESGDTQLSFLLLWLDCRWGNLFNESEQTGDPAICEALARYVNFSDGTPRLEKIDGVVTRHMVATFGTQQEQASGQAVTVNTWVSTDITPTLRQMRVEGSNKLYENVVEEANAIAFSPDGKSLAAAHGWAQDGTIRLYDLNSPGAPQRKLTNNVRHFDSVDYSPDGKLIAATSGYFVHIWDVTVPESSPITSTIPARAVVFQPNGTMLAAASDDGIYLWDPRDVKAIPTVLPVPAGPEGIAFSPDGHTLAAGTWELGVLVYDVRNPKQDPIQLQDKTTMYEWNEVVVDHVAFSPDGQLLASVRPGHVNLWDLRQPQTPLVTLPGTLGDNPSAAFTSDGKFLAVLGENSQVEFWDLSLLKDPAAAHSPVVKLDGGGAGMTSIAFSRDGNLLAASLSDGSVYVWKTKDVLNRQQSETAKPQVFKEERLLIDKPYTLTWNWSRFNEDFGEIKPPPAGTIKQP